MPIFLALNFLISPLSAFAYSYAGDQGNSYANPHAATTIGLASLTYDKNGNLLTRGTNITHTWDYNNRLSKVIIGPENQEAELPDQIHTFAYDPSGLRIGVRPDGQSTTTYPTLEYNKVGTTETISLAAQGKPLASVETVGTASPEIYLAHTDHLGSPRLSTNDLAQIVEKTEYNSLGRIINHDQAGSFSESKKFTGHEYDASSSYTYAKARYLDTSFGRFLSQDPAFVNTPEKFLEDPQQMNSYAYARNNPIKNDDPTGESARNVVLYGAGFLNAFSSNLALGIGRASINEPAYQRGQMGGDMFALGIGALEIALGGATMTGGGAACLTGVGCVVGAPALAAGAAATTHGAGVVGVATENILDGNYNFSSNGNGWGRSDTLQGHFKRHGSDFGYKTQQEYAAGAKEFGTNVLEKNQKGTQSFVSTKDGKSYAYDPATNTYGVYNKDGSTASFYKPGNPKNYWNNKIKEHSPTQVNQN